jgi:subtilisin family serine protease
MRFKITLAFSLFSLVTFLPSVSAADYLQPRSTYGGTYAPQPAYAPPPPAYAPAPPPTYNTVYPQPYAYAPQPAPPSYAQYAPAAPPPPSTPYPYYAQAPAYPSVAPAPLAPPAPPPNYMYGNYQPSPPQPYGYNPNVYDPNAYSQGAYNQDAYNPPPSNVVINGTPRTRIANRGASSIFDNETVGWTVGIAGVAAAAAIGLAVTGAFDGTSEPNNDQREADAQYGVAAVGANITAARGYNGKDAVVAVIDSGMDVSHFEFQGRVVDGNGFDIINNQAGQPAVSELDPHGTGVAGIIAANRNEIGMRGVAYEAKILPIRVIGSDGTGSVLDIMDGVDYFRTSEALVANLSIGPLDDWFTAAQTNGYRTLSLGDLLLAQTYLDAVNAGKILVFAAGNAHEVAPAAASSPGGGGFYAFVKPGNNSITGVENGAYRGTGGAILTEDFSGLIPGTIVVAAVDKDNNIASFSNTCGVTKDWCMVAPGVDIYMPTIGDAYDTGSGTSFAAPHVAAAAAILKSLFPSLTGAQIVQILLTTAKDLGAAGVDDVFGHGLLDVATATNPIGSTGIALTSSVNGMRADLSHSRFSYGSAFGTNAIASLASQQISFLDSYDRGYATSLSNLVQMSPQVFDTDKAVLAFDAPLPRQTLKAGKATVAFQMDREDRILGDKAVTPSREPLASASFSQDLSNTMAATINYRDQDALAFGFQEGDRTMLDRTLNRDAFTNPYALFFQDGGNAMMKTQLLGADIRVAGFFGNSENDKEATNFGSQVDASYALSKQSNAFIGVGSLFEGSDVLGSKGDGAFALGKGTSTFYSGAGVRLALQRDLSLRGAAYAGWTNPALDDNSLINQASEVITTAFNADLEHKNVARTNDVLTMSMAQPLHVESGSMQFYIPYARSGTSDAVYRDYFTQDLGSQGREMDVGLTYMLPLEDNARISAGALYRHDAGHVAGAVDSVGVVRWSKKF